MRRTTILRWLAGLAVTVSMPAHAAEWYALPELTFSTSYNDNVRLSDTALDSAQETVLTPGVSYGVATGNKGISGNSSVSIRRYSGGTGTNSSAQLDREDYRTGISTYYSTPLDRLTLSINLNSDSTLDTELDETGQATEGIATRTLVGIAPSWSRRLNQKTRVRLGYRTTNVSYSDDIGDNNLVDYDSTNLTASLTRDLTSRISATLSGTLSSFQPETNRNSETLSLQAGLTNSFSETLSASFLAGTRETTSDAFIATGFCLGALPGAGFPACTGGVAIQTGTKAAGESVNKGLVYTGSLDKRLESGTLRASISRSTTPTGEGDLLDFTSLGVSGDHRFSERLSLSLSVALSDRETIVNNSGNPDNESLRSFSVKPALIWRWREGLTLTGAYEFLKNDSAARNTATRNEVSLTLRYQPTKISVSR